MNLRQWQQALQAHILTGDAGIHELLAEGPGSQQGLAIYAAAYQSRLLQALADIYPGLQALAGDALLTRYIGTQPPRVGNLRWYGRTMAAWLQTLQPACPGAWIAMAELEWALAMVFEAEDGPIIHRQALAEFAAEDWPRLVLRLVPAWRCLSLPGDLVGWRSQLLQSGRADIPLPSRDDARPWVLWRQGWVVQQRVLAEEEAGLVQGLLAGESLAMLCERLLQVHPPQEVAGRLLGWIELWLQQHWIGAIDRPA